MKAVRIISWVLALIVGGGLLLLMLIQYPTANLPRFLGQLFGAVCVGAIIFFIVRGVGSLIAKTINRRLK